MCVRQAKRAGKRDKERRRRLATLARQQRQEQQQRQEPKPEAPTAPQQQIQQPEPAPEPPQQQQKAQPASKLPAQPQQQQQQDEVPEMKVFSSREWGSADRRERNTRSRLSATGDRQDYSSQQGEMERDREGHYAAGFGSSSAVWDRREKGQGSSDRVREEERGYGSSGRDRVYGTSGRDYSRRSSDDRRHEDRNDSRRDSATGRSSKWQQVGGRSGPSRTAGDKENSQGSKGMGRGHDDDTEFYDRSFGPSRSSRYNRADTASAAAAVAAAVKGLDCGSGRDSAAGYSTRSKLDNPSSSRRYSSLRQQFDASRGGVRGGSQSDGSDSDAPSPMRRQPVSLLSEDPMEWGDGTPSCPQRTRRQHPSWADDVEAAEALCNVCEVMMVQSDQEEGEILEEDSPAERAATRPRSASMTPAKRTAACLGESLPPRMSVQTVCF